MSQDESNHVSITAKFTFPKDLSRYNEEKVLDESNCEPSIIGLPPDTEAKKPNAGDYSYSGMHDHGALSKLKEGGDFALMIGLVNEARKHSDELLTRIIKEEQGEGGRKHNTSGSDDIQGKKARVNEE